MPLLLARIDDRLIHGQVAFGWGRPLDATLFLVVSDALRADPASAELYLAAVPEPATGAVVSVAEACAPETRARVDRERTILLLPGTDEALRLHDGGFPLTDLNVGGIHHAPGRVPVLPYVFLDDADRARLLALARGGVRVAARDLPSNPEHPLARLLGGTTA
ncbi:MAG: PTS system mannose/fructose/N-acetylgalactosamine-transporter subunit IIB [Hyphomicrobiales bacterium]